jgi:hypothetical protein
MVVRLLPDWWRETYTFPVTEQLKLKIIVIVDVIVVVVVVGVVAAVVVVVVVVNFVRLVVCPGRVCT